MRWHGAWHLSTLLLNLTADICATAFLWQANMVVVRVYRGATFSWKRAGAFYGFVPRGEAYSSLWLRPLRSVCRTG